MHRLLLAAVGVLWAGPVLAAPFCVVTSYGTNCWYYDAPSCQRAAEQARGACVVSDQDRGPTSTPRRSNEPPFCVVTSYGRNCYYYDADSCRRAAASSGGGCIVNPAN
jgi:hypothetical protein